MTNKITVPQKCILMRNGVEIWLDSEKAERFGNDWTAGLKAVVKIEGRFLNTVDITGIYSPEDLENLTRRKNGEWQCKKGYWHAKFENCLGHVKEERDPRGWKKI